MKKSPKHLGNLIGIFVLIIAISIVPNVSFGNGWHQGFGQNKKGQKTIDIRDDAMETVTRDDNFQYGYDDYVNIKRTEHPDTGKIDWEVDFMPKGGIWHSALTSGNGGGIKHVVFLPHMADDSAKDVVINRTKWRYDYGKGGDWNVASKDVLNVGIDQEGTNGVQRFNNPDKNRWRSEDDGKYQYRNNTNYFNMNYKYLESAFQGTDLFDTLNFWRRYNVLEGVGDGKYGTFRYCLNDWSSQADASSTWKFTTSHGKGTDLSKVVLIAGTRDYGNNLYSYQRHFRVSGSMGVGAIARMDMTKDIYVDNKLQLTDTEKAAIEKLLKEDSKKKTEAAMRSVGTLSKATQDKVLNAIQNSSVSYEIDQKAKKVVAKMNLSYTMRGASGTDLTFNQPVKMDITDHLKLKRDLIKGSEGEPKEFLAYNGEDVKKDYVKVTFDYNSFQGGKLVKKDEKPESFYYIHKNKKIDKAKRTGMDPELGYPNNVYPGVGETAELENMVFSHWAWSRDGEESKKDAFDKTNDVFFRSDKKELEAKTLYAVYKPILKIVLHNGKDGKAERIKEIPVTKDMFQNGKASVKIDQPYYNSSTPGNLGEDFKRDNESFVGWTIEKGLKVSFGDHLVDNANQISAKAEGKYMIYTLKQLQDGKNLTKKDGKYVNPPYLPNGFNLVLEGDLQKIARDNQGVIDLYANYKPYITVTAKKEFKKYDWTKKKYEDYKGDKPKVYMGLLYRTHVTNFNDPTVHVDANYHPLRPRDYGVDETSWNAYKKTVLKEYTGNNTPTWKVRGYDEFGVRISYSLVEVPDEYMNDYMNFTNDWATLGVQIFHHASGAGINPDAPADPWSDGRQVAKLQTVTIPSEKNKGQVDAFTAATTRKTIQSKEQEGTNDYNGYEIKVANIPVDVPNPNVDTITHSDTEAIISYSENKAPGAQNVDTIHIYYTPKDSETYEYELTLDKASGTWTVHGTTASPDLFKAEFTDKNHTAVRLAFKNPDVNKFFCTESSDGKQKTDKMRVSNKKGQKESRFTPVTFEPLRDSNRLVHLRQEHNETKDNKEYTVIAATLPSPTLYEAKQGTVYALVNKTEYDNVISKVPGYQQNPGYALGIVDSFVQEKAKAISTEVGKQIAADSKNGHNYKVTVNGVNYYTYYLREALPSNSTIYFKIPKPESEALDDNTFYILSIEKKKKAVYSEETLKLDTKAKLDRAEAITSPGSLRASIKAIMSEDVKPSHTIKISYPGKTREFQLNSVKVNNDGTREFIGTSIAPLGQDISVTYIDYFGNSKTIKTKINVPEFITLGVVEPKRYSKYIYVNRKDDSQGAAVTVKVIRGGTQFTLSEVGNTGRFRFTGGGKDDRLKPGDIIDVSGSLNDKTTYPYRVKVR